MSFILILVWIFTSVLLSAAKRPFNLYFTEVECIRHSEPAEEFKCSHHNVNNHRTFIDGYLILSQDITNFQMRAQSDIVTGVGATPMKLFDFSADGCRLLELAGSSNILKVALTYMRKSGHIPERCPMAAKENFSLTNFLVDADMLPVYTPDCSFVLDFSVMIGAKLVTQVKIKGNIESKKKKLF